MSVLEKAQNYIVQSENKSLKEVLETKHKNLEHGWKVNGDVVTFYFSPTVKVSDNPLSSFAEYHWRVDGDRIVPLKNGRALELTPELDVRRNEIENRKSNIPIEQLRIYNYIKQYHLEEDQPIETVLDNASNQFGLTNKEIEEIFIKVDNLIHGNL